MTTATSSRLGNMTFALLTENQEGGNPYKNTASGGIQIFQMFSSTSALLGLSRSADYSAVNANLNALIEFRRTAAVTGQSNMWGQIEGTGLAGSGTGAAGKHGDTAKGAAAASEAYTKDGVPRKLPKMPEPDFVTKYPPSYFHRDPARSNFTVAHRETGSPLEIQQRLSLSGTTEGFTQVKGLQVSIKTKETTDKVLVLSNLPASTQDNHDGVTWAIKRGDEVLGPKFSTWNHELSRIEGLLVPWVDCPNKARLDCDYTVHCRLRGSVQLCQNGEKRQLSAIAFPGDQVATAESSEALAVQPGRWYDVPGLQQISYTNKDEKVLVFCTITYTALWSDEMTRGRFSIFRDGNPLDPEHFGLQSVRALQKNLKRVAVMTFMDEPEEGPHLYEVRAAVTAEEGETRVCHLDDQIRQLSLIRLPGSIVSGPNRCEAITTVDEDKWTEIPGLSVTVTTTNAHDKVLLVWNTNFNPEEFTYEAYFTILRSGAHGPLKNLGGEEQGMSSVASSAAGSSEYPASMFMDAPGLGTFTYTVHARTRRCGNLTEATPVEVGPDGQISAILLGAGRSHQAGNVVEMMTREMEAAGQKAD
eukprot:TRINITY_DN4254_c0_g5_i1.p1 TRINITY_DN4254_c0_g5~~TRINITY_DN4254_c0_g5_i1.p1  ORF type:complete len:587 (+),score=112.59 TRINITY_DN4254_c0_g5_i1:104-1864(+)